MLPLMTLSHVSLMHTVVLHYKTMILYSLTVITINYINYHNFQLWLIQTNFSTDYLYYKMQFLSVSGGLNSKLFIVQKMLSINYKTYS